MEIIVTFQEKVIERIVTDKRRITIGRTADNDIVLENRGISRKHAFIECQQDVAVIIDNETLNGTFVNHRKIVEEMLRNGDEITIKGYTLVYHAQTSAESTISARIISDSQGGELIGIAHVNFTVYALNKDLTNIGKAPNVDLRVAGFFLDNRHATIIRADKGYILNVVGEHIRTKVNGQPTHWAQLQNNDLIQIGRSKFRFRKLP